MAYTTIDDPELYFQTKLYTGTGSSHAITLDGSENMQPDWVWIKRRNSAGGNMFTDVIRGVTETLISNESSAEQTFSNGLTAFGSNGFTVGSEDGFNKASDTFVAWNWLAGGTASSNSNGSITSSVSANTTAGFSIVSYTGTGSNATVGHGLGSAPSVIFYKNRSSSQNWRVVTTAIDGSLDNLFLNTTDAKSDDSITVPSSTVFTLDGSTQTNKSSENIIAYCFAEKKGYSKFGSYTGNGNSNGTFVHTGFKPAWVMIKKTSSSTGRGWYIWDNKRIGYNVKNYNLEANASAAEDTTERIDLLSNGFKWRSSNLIVNESGINYIYMAFAESPFVNSNGVPNNAR